MTQVQPAAGPEPAGWLLVDDVHWWDLVRYGPPGFDVYVRVAVNPYPDVEPEGEGPGLRLALEVLAAHTKTRMHAYALVWEGWTSRHEAPKAPIVPIPERAMLLFAGPVSRLRDVPAMAWNVAGEVFQEPQLVWPEDHAWCLACEVDEEIEFSVGCSEEAAAGLFDAMPGAVRRVAYGEDAPLYRKV